MQAAKAVAIFILVLLADLDFTPQTAHLARGRRARRVSPALWHTPERPCPTVR